MGTHDLHCVGVGLNVGPLSAVLLHFTHVSTIVLQLLKLNPTELVALGCCCWHHKPWHHDGFPQSYSSSFTEHFALALSHRFGCHYSFAAHIMLLHTESNFLISWISFGFNFADVCGESGDRERGGQGGGSNGGQSTIHREELVPGKVLSVDPSCMSYICSSPSRSPP